MDNGYKELFKILTDRDADLSTVRSNELLGCPTDKEIGRAAKQFSDEQGDVPTAFAFQAGARWAREMQKLCKEYGAT